MEVTRRTSNDAAKRQRLQDINVIARLRTIARCDAGSAIAVVAWRIHLLATSRGTACGGRGIDGQHLIYKLKGRPLRMLAASPVAGCASNSPYSPHLLMATRTRVILAVGAFVCVMGSGRSGR